MIGGRPLCSANETKNEGCDKGEGVCEALGVADRGPEMLGWSEDVAELSGDSGVCRRGCRRSC